MNWNLAGGYQRLVQVPANICSGFHNVTTNCPFAVGYGINNSLLGDGIYQFQFNSNRSMCVLGSYSASLTTRAQIGPCSSYKSYWVVSHGLQLAEINEIVNVASTNYWKSSVQVLQSSGAVGGPANVTQDGFIGGGYTSWGWVYR
jgi:hypothetical protein